jgi:phage I-like protein
MDVSSLNLALPPAGIAPDWVHLVPAGSFSGKDGRGPYVLKDAQAVIAASMRHGSIPFDENHSTETASIVGGAAPARGWIDQMQARSDGIWGHVEWTDTGKALMTDKSYRWLSPVLLLSKTDGKTIVAISSVGLTNNPNLIFDLKAMQAALAAGGASAQTTTGGLAAQPAEGQMEKKAICTVLGIPETTEDGAVLVALQTAQAELQTVRTENTRLKGEVETIKTTHVPVSEVTALQTRLNTIETDTKQAKAVAFVDGAIKAGKPIAAAVRTNYIAMHTANPAEIETLINAMPSLNAAGPAGSFQARQDAGGDGELTDEETAMCTRMGTDPKKYKEFLKQKSEGSGV